MLEITYTAIRHDGTCYAGISHIESNTPEAVTAFKADALERNESLKGITVLSVSEIQLPSKVLASYGGIIRKSVDAFLSQSEGYVD